MKINQTSNNELHLQMKNLLGWIITGIWIRIFPFELNSFQLMQGILTYRKALLQGLNWFKIYCWFYCWTYYLGWVQSLWFKIYVMIKFSKRLWSDSMNTSKSWFVLKQILYFGNCHHFIFWTFCYCSVFKI